MNETNNRSNDEADFAELEQFFAAARLEAPDLNDANFTKMVLNHLPAYPKRINTARLRYDVLGILAGGLMALLLIDFRNIFALVWNQSVATSAVFADQITESLAMVNNGSFAAESMVISASTVLGALVIASAACVLAWFAVEKANNVI